MAEDGERFWVLVEPEIGETIDTPGGLFRLRTKGGRQWVELLVEPNLWRLEPGLISYVLGEDTGAREITAEQAQAFLAAWPWPGFRTAPAAA